MQTIDLSNIPRELSYCDVMDMSRGFRKNIELCGLEKVSQGLLYGVLSFWFLYLLLFVLMLLIQLIYRKTYYKKFMLAKSILYAAGLTIGVSVLFISFVLLFGRFA